MAVSSSAIFVRLAIAPLGDAPPLAAAFWRGAIAGLAFLPVLLLSRYREQLLRIRARELGLIAAATTVIATHQICFITSLSYTSVAASTFLTSTQPIFTALLGGLLIREHVSARSWLAVAGAILGMAIITFSKPVAGNAEALNPLLGNLLALLAALLASLYTLAARRLRQRVPLVPFMLIVHASGSVFLILIIALTGTNVAHYTPQTWVGLLLLGLLPTLLGHSLLTYAVGALARVRRECRDPRRARGCDNHGGDISERSRELADAGRRRAHHRLHPFYCSGTPGCRGANRNENRMNPPPIIDVQHLSFAYDEQPVLEDVSFQVQPGEFLGVIGPNGGGKTTLLRILLGLEKGYKGNIRIFGEDPLVSRVWRQRVGVVPQNRDYPLRFPIRAREIVELGTYVFGGPKLKLAERRDRVEEALSLVGASPFADRPLWQLSGGQKQRIFVARALAARPELLFLDEPTVGVDAHGQDLLLEWISRWRKESGLTVILVTHDIGVIAPLADKLACLNGRLHFHDRPERLTGEAIEQAYGCPAELLFHSPHALPHVVLGEHHHTS